MQASQNTYFLYGTLQDDPALEELGSYLGSALLRGRLYDVRRSFPALVPGDGKVKRGHLWRPAPENVAEAVEWLDRIESEGDLYVRRLVRLLEPKGETAWVYVWNGPTAGLERIESGVWAGRASRLERAA